MSCRKRIVKISGAGHVKNGVLRSAKEERNTRHTYDEGRQTDLYIWRRKFLLKYVIEGKIGR